MLLTFDLNWYLEVNSGLDDAEFKKLTFEEKVNLLRKMIFTFDYAIDEKYKKIFETAFISKFMFKEIGFSTFTRWQYEVQAHLNISASRYNNLYKAELSDIEKALNTVNIENVSESENEQTTIGSGEASTSGNSEGYNENRVSDTPQGRLEIDGNYLSGLSDAKQINNSTGLNTEVSEQSSKGKVIGKNTTKGYSGLTLVQLNRIFAEQMIVANELIMYNFENLFLQVMI